MASYTVVFFIRSYLSLTVAQVVLEHRICLCACIMCMFMYIHEFLTISLKSRRFFLFAALRVHVHAPNSSEGANSLSLKMLKNGKEREIERERIWCEREWASERVRCGWARHLCAHATAFSHVPGEKRMKNGLRWQHTSSVCCVWIYSDVFPATGHLE